MDSRTHGLQTGQSVLFREVNGMEELNSRSRQVTGTATCHVLPALCKIPVLLLRYVNGVRACVCVRVCGPVLSPHSFAVGDTSHMQQYTHGGFFLLEKTPTTYRFVSVIHVDTLSHTYTHAHTYTQRKTQLHPSLSSRPTVF